MLLAHDISGSGPAVILLHSTVADRRMWDPQVPALTAAGHQVVRCDLRGYGESPIPIGTDWDEADDVAALLDALGITRTAIIAASGGGRVALEFAVRWPDRVAALALLCTALRGHEPSAALREFGDREDALLEAGDVAGATDLNVNLWLGPEAGEDQKSLVRTMQRNAFDVQLAAEEAAQAAAHTADPATPLDAPAEPTVRPAAEPHDAAALSSAEPTADAGEDASGPAAAFASITAPALLISGAHDLPDFHEIAVQLAKTLPNARHQELSWAGHLPNLERPDLLNPILTAFLADPATKG
ncbi:pimeloyl-ACP methyl ester carboxylesterase [Actinoplanes lutulentus]|uniref:Pimeloyl-ACP methyl ester carboxylesterase n=1 Tax=Actinoplanes lutulentus TaxID=1287878 RepID=A0A327ZB91_9ACTN|nr:alpha/beta hydrolase [Actinoplanes lutulentus]MBB2941487.1 pimeloyl-ACP methyl ester carboxylesterase [Actinoplanes lutulentus]RAK36977.1 pimeloyl-ACP methyl ester carboxylesterase [Actinoplanes lutulentus]